MSRQSTNNMNDEQFLIAQIGRTVGLHGDLKLHIHTDFPEQFKAGTTVYSNRGELVIASYNPTRGIVSFVGYASLDDAKKLTNTKLYCDIEQTKEQCKLGEGQHFWFDIIGSKVYQGEELLGEVEDIDRMTNIDYMLVQTDKKLVDIGLPNSFLLPYIPKYIQGVDTNAKRIDTKDARDILEAS